MPIIDDIFFEKFPFPCLISSERFNSSLVGGSLFAAEENLTSKEQISFYKEANLGWSVCPLGYAVYVLRTGVLRETKMAFFGLKINGISKATGKAKSLSIKLDKLAFESFVKGSIDSVQRIESRLQNIVSSGIHEVRNINKDIYHISYEVSHDNSFNGIDFSNQKKVTSIVHLSEMLKTRSDVFDAITNPKIGALKGRDINIYKAYDRARKSCISSSKGRKNKFIINSDSGEIGNVNAIEMFDVIPYIILENASKYSPKDTEISINIKETKEYVEAKVGSVGPEMSSIEQGKIFTSGFRGEMASKYEPKGSGMGLFVVKQLVDFCPDASIDFNQGEFIANINGINFFKINFILKVKK